MNTKEQLQADTRTAMREGDTARRDALRMLLAAVKQQEVDTREPLSDQDVLQLISKMIKKGRDAAGQFAAAGRQDLADKEAREVAFFEAYMPTAMSAEELADLIAAAVHDTGAQSMRDMGKVMAQIREAVAGRADMAAVSAQVKAALAGS